MRRAAWLKPGWPTANANSSTPAANSKSCSIGIVRPLEVSVDAPVDKPSQRNDGLGSAEVDYPPESYEPIALWRNYPT